jgi:hypothetical protein
LKRNRGGRSERGEEKRNNPAIIIDLPYLRVLVLSVVKLFFAAFAATAAV